MKAFQWASLALGLAGLALALVQFRQAQEARKQAAYLQAELQGNQQGTIVSYPESSDQIYSALVSM